MSSKALSSLIATAALAFAGCAKAAEALGATIRRRFTIINAYSAEIDDSQVPFLRALPGVRYIEDNGFGCLVGAHTTKEPGS